MFEQRFQCDYDFIIHLLSIYKTKEAAVWSLDLLWASSHRKFFQAAVAPSCSEGPVVVSLLFIYLFVQALCDVFGCDLALHK